MIEWTISLGEFIAVVFAALAVGLILRDSFKQLGNEGIELDPIDEAVLSFMLSPDVRHIEKIRANALAVYPYETRLEQSEIMQEYLAELKDLRHRNPDAYSQHVDLHPNHLDLNVRDDFDAHVHAAISL